MKRGENRISLCWLVGISHDRIPLTSATCKVAVPFLEMERINFQFVFNKVLTQTSPRGGDASWFR